MPNLPAHIQLAHQAAARLDHPVVNDHMGSFLLGSTCPDIRSMTRWPRERTHFAPLNVDRVGAGLDGLLQANPGLRTAGALSGPTQAFLAGYTSHLVADEFWILNVYLVHFAADGAHDARVESDIWDRALQLDMNRLAREQMDNMAGVSTLLDGADQGVEAGFIDQETLANWRAWVQEFNTWEFTWDRLRRAVRRMYGDDASAAQMTQQFIQAMPASLDQLYERVAPDGLSSYREGAIDSSVKHIKEYLSAPASD